MASTPLASHCARGTLHSSEQPLFICILISFEKQSHTCFHRQNHRDYVDRVFDYRLCQSFTLNQFGIERFLNICVKFCTEPRVRQSKPLFFVPQYWEIHWPTLIRTCAQCAVHILSLNTQIQLLLRNRSIPLKFKLYYFTSWRVFIPFARKEEKTNEIDLSLCLSFIPKHISNKQNRDIK